MTFAPNTQVTITKDPRLAGRRGQVLYALPSGKVKVWVYGFLNAAPIFAFRPENIQETPL